MDDSLKQHNFTILLSLNFFFIIVSSQVCHSKSSSINPQRIQQLVEAYVGKMRKGQPLEGKKKPRSQKIKGDTKNTSPAKQNGDRSKKTVR